MGRSPPKSHPFCASGCLRCLFMFVDIHQGFGHMLAKEKDLSVLVTRASPQLVSIFLGRHISYKGSCILKSISLIFQNSMYVNIFQHAGSTAEFAPTASKRFRPVSRVFRGGGWGGGWGQFRSCYSLRKANIAFLDRRRHVAFQGWTQC